MGVKSKIEFVLAMRPMAKGRARSGIAFNGQRTTYTPKGTRKYERAVAMAAKAAGAGDLQRDSAVEVWITFMFAAPLGWSKVKRAWAMEHEPPYTARPDLDNLEKAIFDALEGVAYENDSVVYRKTTRKVYGKGDLIVVSCEAHSSGYTPLARRKSALRKKTPAG